MEILILRHGLAERPNDDFDDVARPISERGRRLLRRSLHRVERMGLLPDAILCSPWLRAVHSADLLAETCEVEPQSTPLLARAPGPELLELVAATGGERVALVGHQPWLSELLLLLTFGEGHEALVDRVRIKKSGFAWLRGDPEPGGMQLRALVPPNPQG